MANVFSPAADGLLRSVLLAALAVVAVASVCGFLLVRSPLYTGKGLTVAQPVPFSHAHHVGDDGLDCRYCHGSVERSVPLLVDDQLNAELRAESAMDYVCDALQQMIRRVEWMVKNEAKLAQARKVGLCFGRNRHLGCL